MFRALTAPKLILGLIAALTLTAGCQGLQPVPAPPRAPGEAVGMSCDGFAGIRCKGENQYCRHDAGRCRTVADDAGVCTPRPQACPMIYKPVCGCDGKTYGNSCQAAAAGASVAAEGACEAPKG